MIFRLTNWTFKHYSQSLNPLALSDLSHFQGPLDLEKVIIILVSVKLDLGVALTHDGRWRLVVNLLLKAALRWPGLQWASSSTLTVASRMDHCMSVGDK